MIAAPVDAFGAAFRIEVGTEPEIVTAVVGPSWSHV
jgi:hypothetical protein